MGRTHPILQCSRERIPYITRRALHSPERPVSKGGKQWVTEMYSRDECIADRRLSDKANARNKGHLVDNVALSGDFYQD